MAALGSRCPSTRIRLGERERPTREPRRLLCCSVNSTRLLWFGLLISGCGDGAGVPDASLTTSDAGNVPDAAPRDSGSASVDSGGLERDAGLPDAGHPPLDVDRSDPQLYEVAFSPSDADATITIRDGEQLAALDTRVEPKGSLVVFLHGAGDPDTCGSSEHGRIVASLGFHYLSPCYLSGYGVGNCGDDIGGCRLEAFEGVDHHDLIEVSPADSIEIRVVRALEYLNAENPAGDWAYFVEGDAPRWSEIIVAGISHGASTSGVVGMNRVVERVVAFSGPLDTDQAWLMGTPATPIDRFYGFTSENDVRQHDGHLGAFDVLGLPGEPVVVEDVAAPFNRSHRLVTRQAGHSTVITGPEANGDYEFQSVFEYLYGP